jgi:anaerobic dimethyl sulfoxide reductase subunit A
VVVIDPRKSATCKTLNAQWVPIRPATDGALLDAMAYVIVTKGLQNQPFVEKFCLGWEAWYDYLLGKTDGIPKTPAWASSITGVPEDAIVRLAQDYATAKPAALLPGYGGQRHENGEQFTRATCALAALTGNVGVAGGWAGGVGWCHTHPEPAMPSVENPEKAEIPAFLWTEAILRGPELTEKDGLVGVPRLDTGIKLLFNLAGNQLMNQHGDLNRTARILQDERLCEYIVCSDLFMTPSAKYADLLLPGTSMFEQDNITVPWSQGDFVGFSQKVIEPLGQCRFEYDWLQDLARRLGLEAEFTAGHLSSLAWLEDIYGQLQKAEPELPPFREFRTMGTYRYKTPIVRVAFREQIEDGLPFPTPSGKIELYSPALAAMENDKIPPLPVYVPAQEGCGQSAKYPLQLVGWHTMARCHSVHGNNAQLKARHPQQLWLHPADAAPRHIADGDTVLVYNDRGTLRTAAYVTEDIAPGVTALAQGAWFDPDETGIDNGGNINALTGHTPTPLAHGNPQHTILVEVKGDTQKN